MISFALPAQAIPSLSLLSPLVVLNPLAIVKMDTRTSLSLTTNPRRRRVFPVPWFYAAIRMDPVAMVKDLGLNDAETLEAVEAFNPKTYLVYVNLVSL